MTISINTISNVEFIGESLPTINNNFDALKTGIEDVDVMASSVYTTVNSLSAQTWNTGITTQYSTYINGTPPANIAGTLSKANFASYAPYNNPNIKYPVNIHFYMKTAALAGNLTVYQNGANVIYYFNPTPLNSIINFSFLDFGDSWTISYTPALHAASIFRISFVNQQL